MKHLKDSKEMISLIGEYYVLYKLAQLGVRAYKLPDRFDYDLMSVGNVKIEVKTAHRTYKNNQYLKANNTHTVHTGWQFANHKTMFNYSKTNDDNRGNRFQERARSCDFFVLVCADDKDRSILKSYIVPTSEFTNSVLVWIPESNSKTMWAPYKENWKLITDANKEMIDDMEKKSILMREKKKEVIVGTYSTTEVSEKAGVPQSYITVWCKQNAIDYIPFNKRRGKPLYRITEMGLEQAIKLSSGYKRGESIPMFY